VPVNINYVEALEASTGRLRWANVTAPPPNSGLPTSDTAAAQGVTALPGMAVYAQGSKLHALSAQDGRELWTISVSTGSSFGSSAANVTSLTYVEAGAGAAGEVPGTPFPMLLLQSRTWDQTRFAAYRFNGSAGAPPAVAWQNKGNQDFEGTLRDELAALGIGVPSSSWMDGVFVFWSNRTCGLCARRVLLKPGGEERPAVAELAIIVLCRLWLLSTVVDKNVGVDQQPVVLMLRLCLNPG
jgi:hypothetical protein